jgi:thymidylate synthase
MSATEWPVYFAENLILGSEKSSVGVATLWTPKEAFSKKLKPESYRVIGQLYSNDGINPMIRNVMANPRIRTIVLCGQDKIGSADSLSKLLENGINEKGEVIGKEEARVEKEIPREAVELFRKHVQLLDLRGNLKAEEVQSAIDSCKQNTDAWAEPQLFPEPEITADWFPSEESLYVYRAKTVADVWPKILHGIMRFGEEKMTHYSTKQKELYNVTAVITDEDPEHIAWAPYFNFTKEHFEGYKPQVMTNEPVPSLSYTYGIRLRDHNGVNQIESIIAKLTAEAFTRRAVGVLWNVATDDGSEHPPCLTVVQASINYDKLYLTCYLRSNDMYRGWPENTLAFRTMQKEIADAVGLPMGPLTTISTSAHVYEESFAQIQELLTEYYPKLPCEQDPRGNYVIKVVTKNPTDKRIEVTHMTPQGRKVALYKGTKAMEIFNEIASNEGISVYIHALDLGAELQKAEIALQQGIEYTQDRPLPFDQLKK